MTDLPPAVVEFAARLAAVPGIDALLVAGSLATGDHIPGVSDLDLVAIVSGPVTADRRDHLAALHRALDAGIGAGCDLGCGYVDRATLADPDARHPTWTHGQLVDRALSGVTRAELVRHGFAVFGLSPGEVLPPMTDDDLRAAARAELTGYWAWAARRPWLWLSPVIAELGLTSMARGRHTLATGELLTKSAAIDRAAAPAWLVARLRARRAGAAVTTPRLRTAWIAWRDARRTVARARRARDPVAG